MYELPEFIVFDGERMPTFDFLHEFLEKAKGHDLNSSHLNELLEKVRQENLDLPVTFLEGLKRVSLLEFELLLQGYRRASDDEHFYRTGKTGLIERRYTDGDWNQESSDNIWKESDRPKPKTNRPTMRDTDSDID